MGPDLDEQLRSYGSWLEEQLETTLSPSHQELSGRSDESPVHDVAVEPAQSPAGRRWRTLAGATATVAVALTAVSAWWAASNNTPPTQVAIDTAAVTDAADVTLDSFFDGPAFLPLASGVDGPVELVQDYLETHLPTATITVTESESWLGGLALGRSVIPWDGPASNRITSVVHWTSDSEGGFFSGRALSYQRVGDERSHLLTVETEGTEVALRVIQTAESSEGSVLVDPSSIQIGPRTSAGAPPFALRWQISSDHGPTDLTITPFDLDPTTGAATAPGGLEGRIDAAFTEQADTFPLEDDDGLGPRLGEVGTVVRMRPADDSGAPPAWISHTVIVAFRPAGQMIPSVPESPALRVDLDAGPSQSGDDAERDGVDPLIAKLPLVERVNLQHTNRLDSSPPHDWRLSQLPGNRFELLHLASQPASDFATILEAVQLGELKPQWLEVEDGVVYAGRMGGSDTNNYMLIRHDPTTGETVRAVLPKATAVVKIATQTPEGWIAIPLDMADLTETTSQHRGLHTVDAFLDQLLATTDGD